MPCRPSAPRRFVQPVRAASAASRRRRPSSPCLPPAPDTQPPRDPSGRAGCRSAPDAIDPIPNVDAQVGTDKYFKPHEAKHRPLEEPSTHVETRTAPSVRSSLAEPLPKCLCPRYERDQAHLPTEAGTAAEISISWGQSWFAARHCGLPLKVSGNWRSTPPTGNVLSTVWVSQARARVGSHDPAAPPQVRPRPWWLDRSASRLAWPVVQVSPAPPP